MEKKPLISVIIPVYNAEAYLEACLDSVLGQTYQNLEILLIDDGSTDASGAICSHYRQRDLRIRLIRQPNCGEAVARNTGMQASTGEFLLFLDADDALAPNMCGLGLQNIRAYDVLFYDSESFRSSGEVDHRLLPEAEALDMGQYTRQDWIRSLLGPEPLVPGQMCLHTVWGKLYRKDFLAKHAVFCPPGITVGTDMLFSLQVFLGEPRIGYLPVKAYYYRYNDASVVHRYNPCFSASDSRFHEELEKILKREKLWDTLQADIGYQRINGLFLTLSNDIFHRDNPKTGKEKRKDFLELVSRFADQSRFSVQAGCLPLWKQSILYFAVKKQYAVVKLLFAVRAAANRVRCRFRKTDEAGRSRMGRK